MRASLNTPHDSSMIECGPLPACSRCHRETLPSDSLERPSGRTAASGSGGITPSPIMSPATNGRPSTEIRLGVYYHRAHEPASHPRVLRERGPPKSGDRSTKYKPCNPR